MIAKRMLGATAFVASLALGTPVVFAQQQSTPAAPAAPSAPAASAPESAAPAPSASTKSPKRSRLSRVETRIKTLHAELKITPDQEQEWDAVAQVMRDSASNIDQLAQQRQQNNANMTAVDNLKSYQAIADAHADEMNKLVPAFDALYEKMSPDQQKNADMVFRPRKSHRRSTKKTSG